MESGLKRKLRELYKAKRSHNSMISDFDGANSKTRQLLSVPYLIKKYKAITHKLV